MTAVEENLVPAEEDEEDLVPIEEDAEEGDIDEEPQGYRGETIDGQWESVKGVIVD